jgi:hypothetical protein
MIKVLEFRLQSSELFMVTETPYMDDFIDLGEYRFVFAIEDIDPSFGTISASLVQDSIDDETQSQPIEMERCDVLFNDTEKLVENGDKEGNMYNAKVRKSLVDSFDIFHRRYGSRFLCPKDKLPSIRGSNIDENFDFIKISLSGCQESEEVQCADVRQM